MSWNAASRLARTLMYEGYALYPYRKSALKNQKRWAFGTLYPRRFCEGGADRSAAATEVLLTGDHPQARITARFLQIIERRDPGGSVPWFEAREREVPFGPIGPEHLTLPRTVPFHFPAESWTRGEAGFRHEELSGRLVVATVPAGNGVFRLRAEVRNDAESSGVAQSRDAAYLRSLAAVHVLLGLENGAFASLLEPRPELAEAARACENDGLFPVLVGAPPAASAMLASPIILYDYPQIAPESPGDLFDATEIDELLTLRIRTMTPRETHEAASTDDRVRTILERSQQLDAARLAALHGATRRPGGRAGFSLGDSVRLRPSEGGDLFDVALAGELATICGIEESADGQLFFTVNVDRDPARALGLEDQPGHRFYFREHELERIG